MLSVTLLLRSDGVLLGQMLLEVFSTDGALGPLGLASNETFTKLQACYPDVWFAPTLTCWQEAMQLYEAHLNDEADELIDSLESHEYNLEQS